MAALLRTVAFLLLSETLTSGFQMPNVFGFPKKLDRNVRSIFSGSILVQISRFPKNRTPSYSFLSLFLSSTTARQTLCSSC